MHIKSGDKIQLAVKVCENDGNCLLYAKSYSYKGDLIMKYLFILMVLLLSVQLFAVDRTVLDTRTNWFYAQDSHTIAAAGSPDTLTWTNSFFGAKIWTPSDSIQIKIGTYKNSYTAVDSLVTIPANVYFDVPSYWGVKYLVVHQGAEGENDGGVIYIAGDKQVTEQLLTKLEWLLAF